MRVTLAAYMACLLVWYLPVHTRGLATLGHRATGSSAAGAGESCCAAPADPKPDSPDQPGPSERKNCAVCHWASGVLPVIPVWLDLRPTDVVRERGLTTPAIVVVRHLPAEVLPRGPPNHA